MPEYFETPHHRPVSDAAELGLCFSTAFYVGGLKPLVEESTEESDSEALAA
jgi:hypothetical protein